MNKRTGCTCRRMTDCHRSCTGYQCSTCYYADSVLLEHHTIEHNFRSAVVLVCCVRLSTVIAGLGPGQNVRSKDGDHLQACARAGKQGVRLVSRGTLEDRFQMPKE